MCRYERFFIGVLLGAVFPLIGFLAGWWSTSQIFSNTWILAAALGGLALGVNIDLVFLKKWVTAAYEMDLRLWMVIFLFYTICVFGFFMGVPVFNVVLSIPAGLIIGRLLVYQAMSDAAANQLIFKTNLFTTGIMGFICAASAFLALRDPTTADNLEGMLLLPFEVTQGMIISLIVAGGAGLLGLHWWMVKKTIQFARG